MKTNKVIITGIGSVTPFGSGVDTLWQNTLKSICCSKNGIGVVPDKVLGESSLSSKTMSMTLNSIHEAMHGAKWSNLTEDDGLIVATTTGLTTLWEADLMSYFKDSDAKTNIFASFKKEPLGVFLYEVCSALNFSGRSLLVTTACSASTQALGVAAEWIKQKKVRRCIVVGTETICALTQKGFGCFNLISETPCRPFDKNRNGINLSEGSACVCLESLDTAIVKPLASVLGSGFSSDAHHMTAPNPTGQTTAMAMNTAIHNSGVKKEDISWVHAHGTGSVHNDLAESKAIGIVFNGYDCPPVTSTKFIHGHMLGASGVLETVLCVKSINDSVILPTYGLLEPDPEISINHAKYSSVKIKNILKTTLGFGGINAAIIIGGVNE
ncbi:MAG: beta-ketoacyl-[acyl-carrier-protein] synthase family protein [Proteobacteria bacterium]|nr:beta-ketoacyl-[acyl-carrier-protein] synthase family protein [Pseudomonadota bacterium]